MTTPHTTPVSAADRYFNAVLDAARDRGFGGIEKLTVAELGDPLAGIALDRDEQRAVAWLAGWDETAWVLADLIRKARNIGPPMPEGPGSGKDPDASTGEDPGPST